MVEEREVEKEMKDRRIENAITETLQHTYISARSNVRIAASKIC